MQRGHERDGLGFFLSDRSITLSSRGQRPDSGGAHSSQQETTRRSRVLNGNNAGPWRRLPALGLVNVLTAPSDHDVGGQPLPIFTPAGRHRGDIDD
jgi:hypothetical protein